MSKIEKGKQNTEMVLHVHISFVKDKSFYRCEMWLYCCSAC